MGLSSLDVAAVYRPTAGVLIMVAPSLQRRALLRGRTVVEQPLRPPWSGEEGTFLDACTSCGDCLPACPEGVLVEGAGGHPRFDPTRGECTFCGACVEVCAPQALAFRRADPPWRLKATITSACLTYRGVVCLSCRDACGEAAIRFRPAVGGSRPELDVERCTGCAACVNVCPTAAILVEAPAEGRS